MPSAPKLSKKAEKRTEKSYEELSLRIDRQKNLDKAEKELVVQKNLMV